MWTLRAYAHEKQCQIDACFADYLQALSLIDEAWGDPRKRGGRGHPFAMLLTWKLGLISYSRGDVKSIDKFADYFRSLALYHGCDSPFSWGPPFGTRTDGHETDRPKSRSATGEQRELGLLLRASEACMWAGGTFWAWWRHYDVLNFVAERLMVPGSVAASPADEGISARAGAPRRRALQVPEDGITAELQEVRRGTIFAFGSNVQGQLGVGLPTTRPLCGCGSPQGRASNAPDGAVSGNVTLQNDRSTLVNGRSCSRSRSGAGPDLWWSGRPVRIMALKECRMKDIACGEAHCVALDLEGHLFAWGGNEWCQVRDHEPCRGERCCKDSGCSDVLAVPAPTAGEAVHLPMPVQVSVRFAAVACGSQFSVALDRSGSIWTWGGGEGGVLGLGVAGLSGRARPGRVEPSALGTCTSVACGSFHSLAIIGNGELYAWGRAEGGQLGIAESRIVAHIELRGLDDTCVCEPLRVFFNGGMAEGAQDDVEGIEQVCDEVAGSGCQDSIQVRQAAGGDVHTVALDVDGQVWSWGWGEFGQLGLGFSAASYSLGIGGASSKRLTPHKIKQEHFGSMVIKAVACGGAFSAAVGDANKSSPGYTGNLFLWGANEVGQCALAPKKPVEVGVPTKVKGLAQTFVRSVACGSAHAVAVDVAGRAYSWGSAQYGQLGSFSLPKTSRPPPAFDAQESEGGTLAQHQPTLIQSVSRLHIMKAACGLHHSLLISEVSGESVARRAGKDAKDAGRRAKGLPDAEIGGEARSGATGPALAA
uniref:Ultraviolet-B receptor UVR8 n=1 Tax=Alexandrium catenella TaxID=2925 RepID=A0A7S1RVS7_ALECA